MRAIHPLEAWGYVGAPRNETGRADLLDRVRQWTSNSAATRRHLLKHESYRPCPADDDCREALARLRAVGLL